MPTYLQIYCGINTFVVDSDSVEDDPFLKEFGFKRFKEVYQIFSDQAGNIKITEITGGLSINLTRSEAAGPLNENHPVIHIIKKKDQKIVTPNPVIDINKMRSDN